MIKARIDKLTSQMAQHHLDCVAILPGPNMHYFTDLHFHLSERPIVALFPQTGEPALIVPGFESFKTTAVKEPLPWRIFAWSDEEGAEGAFSACYRALQLDGKQLGVESLGMRYLEYNLLTQNALGLRVASADALISGLRQIKDAEEVRRMKEAVRIVELVLAEALPKIKIGMTEQQLAAELKIGLFRAGSGPLPFEPLVQTGATGATPHASPGERQLAAGDLLIIDFGASYDGYASDLTRTFAVGQIDDKARQIYETVKQANEAGRQNARPGLACGQLDAVVRRVIDQADYGEYFIHRTGHGLGLEGHEPPYIVAGNEVPLEPGMTFTIEPGIYFQGVGGVRIEDNVVITATGVEVLTGFDRDLMTVG